jgi:hypothetical protein
MSLDVDLMVVQPCSVYSGNITHNLNKMAMAVELSNGKTLYDVLWRPDEHEYTKAIEIVSLLSEGLVELVRYPEKYKTLNPSNGWGSYDGLIEFVKKYHSACLDNPEAEIRVSR